MRPTWLVDVLAALMLLTAAYCLGRLLVARLSSRATHLDVDMAHVAMGVAMAGMLVPSLRSFSPGIWEIVFAAMAAWFTLQVVHFVRRWGLHGWDDDHLHHASHYGTHLAMVVAMLYMFVALPMAGSGAAAGMSAMGAVPTGAAASGLPLIFAFILFVAAVWYGDSLTRFARARMAAGLAPAAASVEPAQTQLAGAAASTGGDALAAPQGRIGGGTRAGATLASRPRPRFAVADVLCAQDRRWLAPRLEIATHITMCFTMGYMLIVMR
ncbi:MAG TPA: DUF5134 domain-containing protein [Acidimicrobiales bacterium]|nr:DUF5134 domain-containing protein [Acidimicrobiales bacterium]